MIKIVVVFFTTLNFTTKFIAILTQAKECYKNKKILGSWMWHRLVLLISLPGIFKNNLPSIITDYPSLITNHWTPMTDHRTPLKKCFKKIIYFVMKFENWKVFQLWIEILACITAVLCCIDVSFKNHSLFRLNKLIYYVLKIKCILQKSI